jgi:hypothetical protein
MPTKKQPVDKTAYLRNGVETITYERDGFIYIIENSTSEWGRSDSGYFLSLGDAVDAMQHCCDWWRSNGTGRIYRVKPGLHEARMLVWEHR